MNYVLTQLIKEDLRTENLLDQLKIPLENYINLIEEDAVLKNEFQNDIVILQKLLSSSKIVESFDYYNKEQFQNLFSGKKATKIPKYIKIISNLNQKIKQDKKCFKVLFESDQNKYISFLKENYDWMLKLHKYDYITEDIVRLMDIIKLTKDSLFKKNQYDKINKFNQLLIQFINEKDQKFPYLELKQKYLPKQNEIQQDNVKQQQQIKQNQNTVKQDIRKISKVLEDKYYEFQDAFKYEYEELDQELKQTILQLFVPMFGQEQVITYIFNHFDQRLGKKQTPNQARCYKKLLMALQKMKLIPKFQMDILFEKCNRFLSKQNVGQEKSEIKYQIKQEFIQGKYNQVVEDDNDDEYEDIGEEEEEEDDEQSFSSNSDQLINDQKRTYFKDKNSNQYLKQYREKTYKIQEMKYNEVREIHEQIRKTLRTIDGSTRVNRIDKIVQKIYKEQFLTKEDLEKRDKVIENIKNAFKNSSDRNYPFQLTGEIRIYAYGSSQNGLWNRNSDIDITAIFSDRLAHNQHQMIKMCSFFIKEVSEQGTLTYVPAYRVPILKFVEKETKIEVDFNVNNVLGIHNSELIYTYCKVDQRFHILCQFIKYWAKQVGIIGASKGMLSSYALVLMIIAFLQCTNTPVLPCLQEKKLRTQKKKTVYYPILIDELDNRKKGYINSRKYKDQDYNQYCLFDTDVFFEQNMQIIKEKYMKFKRNEQSVPELLFDFFYFYVYEFDQGKYMINIKDGEGFTRKIRNDKFPFSIIDPFEIQRNPGCSVTFNSYGHKKIMMQFRSALDQFKNY